MFFNNWYWPAIVLLTCACARPPHGDLKAGPSVVIRADSASFGARYDGRQARVRLAVTIMNDGDRRVYLSPCYDPRPSTFRILEKLVQGGWHPVYQQILLSGRRKICRLDSGESYADVIELAGPVTQRGMGTQFRMDSLPGMYRAIYGVYTTREGAESIDGSKLLPREALASNPFLVRVDP